MTALAIAYLLPVKPGSAPPPPPRHPAGARPQVGGQVEPRPDGAIPVQFNPSTLRLALTNGTEIKKAAGKSPATQFAGASSAVLTFDLSFDTADTGTDVRLLVDPLRELLLPAKGVKSMPPMVQFGYGTFALTGILTSLNVDYELFTAAGAPMRAKGAVTIKELDPRWLGGQSGPAANTGAAAQDPGGLSPASGDRSGGRGPSDTTATSRAGESAPTLMARAGAPPGAWKNLDLGGLDPLSLPGGVSLDVPILPSVVGLTAGPAAAAQASGAASATEPAPVSSARTALRVVAGAGADPGAAQALTAAGGLQGAIDRVVAADAAGAASASRVGFAVPGAPSSAGAEAVRAVPRSRSADIMDEPDRRSITYGRGVPLRESVGRSARVFRPAEQPGSIAGARRPGALGGCCR